METFLELCPPPHKDVFGDPKAQKFPVRQIAFVKIGRRLVWDDNHEIVVAVWPKEVDPQRMIILYQPSKPPQSRLGRRP
jgi:hypothetical protein